MPILNIVEYENNLSDNHLGDIVAIQNIEFNDSSPVYTNRFSYRTGSIRIAATQNCWLKFTAGDDVVSGENDGILLFASNPQRFRVESGYRISVLEGDPSAGTGGGTRSDRSSRPPRTDVDLSDAYQTEYTGDWLIAQALKAETSLQPEDLPPKVTAGEITAGNGLDIRSFSVADIVAIITAHL